MLVTFASSAFAVLKLRLKMSALFLRRLSCVGKAKPSTDSDDSVVQAIVDILTAEDGRLNLHQPEGVGQRPKMLGTERKSSRTPKYHNNGKIGTLRSDFIYKGH